MQADAESLPLPSEPSSHSYDNLHHKENEEEGMEPAVGVGPKGNVGTSTGETFEMTALLDQGSKVHMFYRSAFNGWFLIALK